jgi:hypothetical protein
MNDVPVENQRKSSQESKIITSAPRLLDPVKTMESVLTAALKASSEKKGISDTDTFLTFLKQRDAAAFNYYCYHIAKGLGEVLGSWSNNIRAVYACNYDEDIPCEDSCEEKLAFFNVHLIIWAEQKSKALDSLLEAMDRSMVHWHRGLLGDNKLQHILDAQIIDDEDMRNRTGYAALINSVYQPPIRVWGK